MKPNFPIIVMYARDWSYRSGIHNVKTAEDIPLATAWIVGWLIKEKKDVYVVAFENFNDEGMEVRNINVIPKENVIFKRMIPKEVMKKLFD